MDLGSTLWQQREAIRGATGRIQQLIDRVGAPSDLNAGQWAQLYAVALDFAPDLIIDLGRGYGNATCALTDAANQLGGTRVASIGFRDDHVWAYRTEPRLRNVLPSTWFDAVEIIEQDVRRVDFQLLYGSAKRILMFWDMLGYGVSRYILEHALPLLCSREHLVIVKDVTDARYHEVDQAHRMAGLLSPSNEVRALGEFLVRNCVRYETAEHALRVWRDRYPDQAEAVAAAWSEASPPPGPTQAADWIYFEVPAALKPNPGVFGRIRQLVAAAL
jgi:hypothetical protein